MNSFELIEKYLPKAIDKYFFEDAKSAILEQGSKFIDVKFDQTGYVKIASILMDGLSDYYATQQPSMDHLNPVNSVPGPVFGGNPSNTGRPLDPANYAAYAGNTGSGMRDGFALGNTTVQWEIFRLQWVRGKQFRIDYIADEETAGIVIGNAVEEFNRAKVIPEVDVCRFGVIADKASQSLGNLKTESPTAANIISDFNAAFEWLSEHEVPEEEQIIFVNPAVMTLIRNSSELTKFLTQGDYRSPSGLDFTVEKYGGRPIIMVPSNRFFTLPLLTQNGYRASGDSKVINYMVVSTKAVVPVRKLEWSKVYGPEQSGLAGFHGYLINYLLYHGVVIPRNKIVGCFVSVSETAASSKVNTLAIDERAGYNLYGWTIVNSFTSPAGLRGTLYYSYSNAFPLGQSIVGREDAVATGLGVENSGLEANTSAYFGLVDDSGTIIATTGATAITLARKTA